MKKMFFVVILILVILVGCDIENPTSPDETSPRVLVTYPGNWDSIYEEEIVLSFEVIEDNVDSVFVYLNGEILSNSLQEPYQITVNLNNYEPGLQTLYCKAVDESGNIGISTLINFYWSAEPSDIQVNIVRPVLWEEFETIDVNLSLNVQSEQAVESVAIYIDGNLVYTFTEAPYETILQVNSLGSHNIYALATDVISGFATSEIVNFTIILPDYESPSGFIAYPADWTNVNGNFEVRVSAIDNAGIEKVELYIDGEYHDEVMTSPYNLTVNSVNWINGNHTIYAKIIDTSQNYSYTQLINIIIEN